MDVLFSQLYKNFFEHSADALFIFVVSANGPEIVAVNPATVRLFEAGSKEELIGMGPNELSPEKQFDGSLSMEKAKKEVDLAIKNGSHRFIWAHKTLKDNIISCEVSIHTSGHNEDLFLMASVRDISEQQKQLEQIDEQRLFLKTTVDTMPAIFYCKDMKGNFKIVNESFRQVFNLSDEQIISKNQFELFPKEVAEEFKRSDLETAKNKKVVNIEEFAFDDSGNKHYYDSYKFPYINNEGEVVATGGISIDITEKKEIEKILFHNSKLASLGELAAGVGHEINNPLTIIKGYINVILKNALKKDPIDKEFIEKYLEKSKIAVDRITNIVGDLRRFSRVEDTEKEMISVLNLCEEVFSMYVDFFARDEVELKFIKDSNITEDSQFYGSRGRIQQVLVNLLVNAKDAVLNSEVKKILFEVEIQKGIIVFSVSDTGSGIPLSVQDKIFDPFFTTKEVNKGTGIGLALSHTIIKEHDGKIEFFTKDGEGTKFTVSIPIVEVDKFSDLPLEVENHRNKKILFDEILIVEDEPEVQEVLAMIVGDFCLTVHKASHGEEGLDILKNNDRIKLIISDIKMPIMNGVELLDVIRRDYEGIKFVFITAGVNLDLNNSKLAEKYDGCILKPFEEEEVIELLEELSSEFK